MSFAMASAAQAQTMGYADAVRTLAAACTSDIDKYCNDATLANNGITNCLTQQSAKVSPSCTNTVATVVAAVSARREAQLAAPRLCDSDARQLCGNIKGGNRFVLQCLLKAERRVSKSCNSAITAAGWR
ncbi:hypothetical protein RDV64_10465 [Acuticoccus sp. MNP-M23]|uniref:hypothetical protein n=1 Tax=Acuticoccus sp. MNP-M23 TaxID=3072793 RepID=UPI0028168AA3|nr:hypothetical protein [Acuticoccus sp. MNP-M23]WMS44770.1 hypothetical protein RDV64_10465 [Acuticoccus sp. MNP-M23]